MDIVSFILARASSASAAPVDWEHIYRSAPLSELPWYSESVEPDVSAAISQFAPEALRVLDIGAGPGTFAIEMARRGCDVTALDLSAAALDAARVRAADLGPRIRWRVADFLQAHFDESFELAFDRGCLHVLQITQLGAYVKQAAQSLSAGGVLILKTFLAGADHPPGTLAFSAEDIGRLFGSDFTVRFQKESTFLSGATHYPDLLSVLCKR